MEHERFVDLIQRRFPTLESAAPAGTFIEFSRLLPVSSVISYFPSFSEAVTVSRILIHLRHVFSGFSFLGV